ncbi:MFS transporter [Aeromicrobium massiliense]|uniref:MFS transporter n=1 Tax=Aeromicrobium massiliense TaxID=1464554 RepID=UPI0009D98643|nr:MFS transporter [Aeromicrobium massiliense]
MSPAAPHPGHRPGTPGYRRLNVAMLMAGVAAFGMLYSTQPLLPRIGEAFDVSPAAAALTVSAATGALAVAVVVATSVAARLGRARVMRATMLAAVVVQLLSTTMPTFGGLLALRVLLGLLLAGVVGVAMGHVGAEVHPDGLGRAMGLYVAGNSLGGVGGRLVTAAVADLGSWRVADAALGVCALAATIAFVVLLPPSVHGEDETGPRPHPGVRAWLRPQVLALVAVPFLLMGGFVAVYNYLTYRLVEQPFELPSAVVGLVFLAYLAGTVSSALAGAAADRFGRPRTMALSLVVMAGGLALTLPDHLAPVVAGLVLLTAGFFAAHAVASGWMPLVAGTLGGRASGAYVTSYYAGSSVLGAVVGLAWSDGGWPAVAAAVGATVLATAVCVVVVRASGERPAA